MTVLKSACGAVIISLYAVALMTAFGCDDSTLSPTPVDKAELVTVQPVITLPYDSRVCELIRSGKLQPFRPVEGC